jgi:hypothetical protein
VAGFEANALNLSLLTFFHWKVSASEECPLMGSVLEMSVLKMGFLRTIVLILNVSEVNVETIEKVLLHYFGYSFHHGGGVADGVGLFAECYCYYSCSYCCATLLDL